MVRSLGWTEVSGGVSDDRLVHSRVHKSISRLSIGRHDINDAVGRWGDVRIILLYKFSVAKDLGEIRSAALTGAPNAGGVG